MILFPAGSPVFDRNFINRKEEIRLILDLIEINQHISIIAPRRLGKTSLTLKIGNLVKNKYFFSYIDLFSVSNINEFNHKFIDAIFENKKIKKFTEKIKKGVVSLIKNIEIKALINEFEYVFKFIQEDKLDQISDKILNLPEHFATKYKKKLVVVFDEFGDIEKLNGSDLLKKFRSYFQRHKNVVYIFTGSQESMMKEIFSSKSSPFYNFARIIKLGNINKDEFRRYIINEFKKVNLKLEKEAIDLILNLFNGHPFYTQLLCQKIYLINKGEKKLIKLSDVKNAVQIILNDERPYFEHLWEQLKNRKNFIDIIKFLVKESSNPYKYTKLDRQLVYFVISELEKIGIVRKKEKSKYELTDPLFYLFVKEIII